MEKVKPQQTEHERFANGTWPEHERYGLDWPGKRAALLEAGEPTRKRLVECREESVDFDSTQNLFIEGDNLDALKLLRDTHRSRVKMIYIDPPYNTGQDLIYRDDFAADAKLYSKRSSANGNGKLVENCDSHGRFHAEWLSMISPRLKIARDLLRDDGVIFISIDDNEAAQLRLVCDEIFGQVCFVNQIVVKSSETSGVKMSHTERRLPKIKEYLLLYSKTPGGCNFFPVTVSKQNPDDYLKYYRSIIMNPDEPAERWRIASVLDTMLDAGLETNEEKVRAFKLQNAGRVVYRTNNRLLARMTFDTETAEVISSRGKKYFWWQGKQMLFLSDHLSESLCDLWTDLSTINLNKEMLGLPAFARGQKPLALLERCLKLVCPKGEESIVMDFFAGSGSLGHAVMVLAREGYPLRFVLVQNSEKCEPRSAPGQAGFENIADLARERLRRAAEKVSKATMPKIPAHDFGFRVVKIS